MSGWKARRRTFAAAAGALLVVAATAAGIAMKSRSDGAAGADASAERPELLLLSALPIVFPEEFTLDAPKSPTLEALERGFRVTPVSLSDSAALAGKRLLLMAQPRAQPAEALVDLDEWVRRGGRVLLLADPALEWPSKLPLGDVRRPPAAFADTGLLARWGLRLDAPDELGPATFTIDGRTVHALSPGILVRTGEDCLVTNGGFVARCRVGHGEAIVIADADFVDVAQRRHPARSGNLDFLLAELKRLGR